MKWSEVSAPIIGVSSYTHTWSATPLGICMIEWKSWKDSPDYGVEIGGEYIATTYSLDEAKDCAHHYLVKKSEELIKFLK